jgi:hypothetical protein
MTTRTKKPPAPVPSAADMLLSPFGYVHETGLRLRFVCRDCGKGLRARALDTTDEACRFVQRYEIEAAHECSPVPEEAKGES